ncbi:MAG: hypothetical protein SOW18_05575 [Peptoniphilus sp.]|nr:hypothetical protein [Peptoniphilus sp.]MDY3118987.1 hypothetical protein [Peptoniphilus sp.]
MKETFTVTEDDYLAYQWHLFKHNPTAKRTMRIQMISPIAVFVAIGAFYFFTKRPLKGLLPLAVALVLWPFLYQFFFNRSMKKRLRQLIRKMQKDLPLGEHKVLIDNDGIRDKDLTVAYDAIRYAMENQDFLYIFYDDSPQAYLLPKSLANEKILATLTAE